MVCGQLLMYFWQLQLDTISICSEELQVLAAAG